MAIARERLTVAGTAVGLTRATYGGCQYATITVETAAIRFTLDGTAPVGGALGHLVQPGETIDLGSVKEVAGFKAIRDTGTSAAIEVTYRSHP